MKRFVIFIIFIAVFNEISGKGCEPNPCLNGGLCEEITGSSAGYKCQCQPDHVGINCDLPPPEIVCGKKAIEVEIDERIIEEMQLPLDEKHIYFDQSPGCRAVKRQNNFHLRIDAPFVDCGLSLEMVEENFIFSQKVIWNNRNGFVERPVVIVDFKCSYSGKYNVSFDPIKPTVTTVDFDTTYGEFTLQMDLFKSQSFEEKFNLRPVVAIDEEVCIKNEISGKLPEELVLSTLRCWGSNEENGAGDNYDIIHDRCLADDSNSVLINNGDSDVMKFCFNVFKWTSSLKAVYIHCKVQVCNSTRETCDCVIERAKRNVEEAAEENSAKISSQRIMIVESKHFTNWLDFLESDNVYNDYEANENGSDDYTDKDEYPETNKRTVLLAVGIILVLVIVGLGVLVGVVVSYTKKKSTKKPAKKEEKCYDVFA